MAVDAGSASSSGFDAGFGALASTTVVSSGALNRTSMPMPPPRLMSANDPISCWTSSSRTRKSAAVRSVTGLPFLSRTTTSTRIAVVRET